MKIASKKKKVNIYRRKQKILVCFLEANLISFSDIPRNFKKSNSRYTHNSPNWLDFRPIWWPTSPWTVLLYLSHTGTETMMGIQKNPYWPRVSDPSPDATQNKENNYFNIFPIWSTPFGKFYPKSMNPHEQIKKFLDEIFTWEKKLIFHNSEKFFSL